MARDSESPFPPNLARRLSYWALGIALVLLVLIGVAQTLTLQRDIENQELERARNNLSQEARRWDATFADRTEAWLQNLSTAEDVATRQRYYREREPSFDSFYLWHRPPFSEPEMLFPAPVLREDLRAINRSPCMARAHRVAASLPTESVHTAYLACTDDPNPQVALFASTEAASMLLDQGRAVEAASALDSSGVDPMELRSAEAEGVSVRRMAVRRMLEAQALAATGRERFAAAEYADLAAEILNQNGPALEELLHLVEPLLLQLEGLEDGPARAAALRGQLPDARQRLQAWQSVRDQLAPRAVAGADRRVLHDQLGGGFLLVYSDLGDDVFGAVQLDEVALLQDLAQGMGDDQDHLVVSRGGTIILGAETEAQMSVAFPETLSHLRLGYGPSFMVMAQERFRYNLLSQLLPIMVGGLIGVAALTARVAADRQQEELLERQREFATRVTHELKTPLAGIRVMAESLDLMGGSDPATASVFAQRILSEVDKLTARIDEILSVARARRPSRPEPYSLNSVVDSALREWQPRFDDAGVYLGRRLANLDGWQVVGDASLLRDAFVCLLDNAIKYRRDDGVQPKVEVRLRRERRGAVLEVVDNGIGVPPGKRSSIFQPFARVEGPGRGKAGGHGLGLAFVSQAMQQHGGRVECKDGLDGGARFVLRVPLTREKS